jgi:hypothetical protein
MRLYSIGRQAVVLGFLLAFTLSVPVAQAAKGGDNATELKAREAFAAGRYEDALNLFAKLYAETLHPVYLRNIGRCHQKLRQPDQAIDKFNEYLAKEKKISADERKEIDGYIQEMQALKQEQARQATPTPPANPPPPVTPINPNPNPNQPPPNYYAAPPPGNGASGGMLVGQPGPRPGDEETPIYKKWWFWTGIGAVAVGTVVAVVLLSGGTEKPGCPSGVMCK